MAWLLVVGKLIDSARHVAGWAPRAVAAAAAPVAPSGGLTELDLNCLCGWPSVFVCDCSIGSNWLQFIRQTRGIWSL